MSSSTINLISPEDVKKQYWEQYDKLSKALADTAAILTALGETVHPNTHTHPTQQILPPSQRNMTALVKDACIALKTGFTRDDVISYISKVAPNREIKPKSISAMISNMCSDNGFLKIIESGTGGTLGVYAVRNKE